MQHELSGRCRLGDLPFYLAAAGPLPQRMYGGVFTLCLLLALSATSVVELVELSGCLNFSGNNSLISINSPFQIFFANFVGTGKPPGVRTCWDVCPQLPCRVEGYETEGPLNRWGVVLARDACMMVWLSRLQWAYTAVKLPVGGCVTGNVTTRDATWC